MKIKAVFFDAGETLIHRNPSLASITDRYLREEGITVGTDRLNVVFQEVAKEMKDIVEKAELKDSEKWVVLMKKYFKKLGLKNDPLMDKVRERLKRGTSFRLYNDVWPTLRQLRKRNIKAGVISNAPAELLEIFRRLDITRCFDWITVSELAGYEKPDKRIFEAALKNAKCRKDEVIYVGDNLLADIKGAINAGIQPVWVLRKTKHAQFTFQDAPVPDGVPTLHSLGELPGLMEKEGWA
jgi:putative hydrolase of the HAD superfamily